MARRAASLHLIPAVVVGLATAVRCAAPCLAAQQPGAILGRLIDRDSHEPVSGARIGLLGARRDLPSDSAGRFAHEGLKPGTYVVQVRAVGYSAASRVVQLGDGQLDNEVFELERLPYTVDPVTVERRPSFADELRMAFERRRAAGRGHFITEEQIERANARSLVDLFRNVPGMRTQCRGSSAGCTVRMTRAPRECKPDFVLDGFTATNSTSLDMPTIGIIGIEIYRTLSETPLQFLRADNQCGTIVIWTKSGPR
jgi:hypothetical protein